MKLECPSCKKSGQVDDSKIPITKDGAYVTCLQCNNKFQIKLTQLEQVIPSSQQTEYSSATQSQKCGDAAKADTKDYINADNINYYKIAIGKNFDKYIDVINFVKSGNNYPTSWHWPALFVGAPWAFYRKMYKVGFIYFIIDMLLGIVSSLLNGSLITIFISLGVAVAFAVYAKAIYVKHVKKIIQSNSHFEKTDLIATLSTQGGTNAWVVYLCLIPVIGIIAAIAIPQFVKVKKSNLPVTSSPESTSVSGARIQTPPEQKTICHHYLLLDFHILL